MTKLSTLENIFHLSHAVKRQMHVQIESLDLDIAPMHMRTIKIIDKRPSCTAIDIAKFLHRDKAQVTRLLNTLIAQNLISKVANPEDKRSQLLVVTDSGKQCIARMKEVEDKMMVLMTENIDEDVLDLFDQTAKKLMQNLSKPS